MVYSEEDLFDKVLKEYTLGGNVVRLTPETAVKIVRYLGAQTYKCAGGVLPGDQSGRHSDAKVIGKELKALQANYDVDVTEFVVGPHVIGVDDENGPTYYPRGAMLFVRSKANN